MKKLFMFMLAAGLLAACSDDKTTDKPKEEPEDKPAVEEPTKEEATPDSSWDDMKDPDKIVGKSDQDFKKMSKRKPGKVNNDKTGKWKKTVISEDVDIEKYLLSYEDSYMKDGETHFIVNLNSKTTTVVNKMSGLLYAEVHEYEKKEEHDADAIGSGMLLKSYTIYPDGDIEETE